MASKERVLKLTIMQRRNPAMSEDEFHAHWTEKHAPIATAWLQRNGILGYKQYHTPKATRDLAMPIAQAFGWKISEYDGHVEFMVRSLEDLKKATEDPDYPEKVLPDEKRFMDQANSMVTVGWEEVYIEDGKIVNLDENQKPT